MWSDPQGGKYAHPSLPMSLHLPPPDQQIMDKPGFKVIHEANIDTNSTCLTFVICLRAVKKWSDANSGHVPIMIDVEMKDTTVAPATFDALDAEIRSVFPADDLITPDDVRGSDPSLGHAVRARGWPTLGTVRGRVMFMLDNENFAKVELAGHPSLRGRILFTSSSPGADDAAVAKLNDPVADAAKIKAALAANMLVRTRADADTVQARADDTTMRDAALAGGAQFVSTDYEVPNPKFGPYVVKMPGGTPARCNPVTAPPSCQFHRHRESRRACGSKENRRRRHRRGLLRRNPGARRRCARRAVRRRRRAGHGRRDLPRPGRHRRLLPGPRLPGRGPLARSRSVGRRRRAHRGRCPLAHERHRVDRARFIHAARGHDHPARHRGGALSRARRESFGL